MRVAALGLAIRRWCAAALALLAVGAAHAAVYVGVFDPRYGAPFDQDPPGILGFEGSVRFVLPGNCGITTESALVNIGDCAGGGYVESARVSFYRVIDNSPDPDTRGPEVAFAEWNFPNGSGSPAINSVLFDAGKAVQLDSGTFTYEFPSRPGSSDDFIDSFASYEFALEFAIGFSEGAYDGVLLRSRRCWEGEGCDDYLNDFTTYPPTFRIVQVPEPATAALVALALCAAGLTAPSRRRARLQDRTQG